MLAKFGKLMDASQVDKELEDFELYLAPSTCFDLVNTKVELSIVRDSHPAGDHIFFSAKSQLCAATLALRSCFKVAIKSRSKRQHMTHISSQAMMMLLVREGVLDSELPSYREDVREWVEILSPRGEPMTQDQQMDQLACKAMRNCFGRIGPYETFMLDMGSFVNHSCAPNAAMLLDADLCEASIITIDEVPAGRQIFISYIPFPIDSRTARKDFLEAFDFECLCTWCVERLSPSVYYALCTVQSLNSRHCWYCGNDGRLQCRRCKHANYCSKACLRLNAKTHRQICTHLKTPTKLVSVDSNMVPINQGLATRIY